MKKYMFLPLLFLWVLCVFQARAQADCACPETSRALSRQTLMESELIAHVVLFGGQEKDGVTESLIHIGGIYYQRDPAWGVGKTVHVVSDEHQCNMLSTRKGVDGERWSGDIVLYRHADGRLHYRSDCDAQMILDGEWQTLRAGYLKKKKRPAPSIEMSGEESDSTSACGGGEVVQMSVQTMRDCAVPEDLPDGAL